MNIQIFYQLLRELKGHVRRLKYKNTLSLNPMHDDVYIVEFPKSGVTWLSFLLASIQNSIDGFDVELTFYNHHKYVIDVHQLRGSSINRKNSVTYIKSHSHFNPFYYFVIYLVRNPFDVMVSYYNFSCSKGYTESFDLFLKSPKTGVLAWKRHINSWCYKKVDAQRIHFLRYEDLIEDPGATLNALYLNFGQNVNNEIIKKSIQVSNIENMRASEEHYRNFNKNYSMNFVGKSGKKKKNELFTDYLKAYLLENLKDELELFYPEMLLRP